LWQESDLVAELEEMAESNGDAGGDRGSRNNVAGKVSEVDKRDTNVVSICCSCVHFASIFIRHSIVRDQRTRGVVLEGRQRCFGMKVMMDEWKVVRK